MNTETNPRVLGSPVEFLFPEWDEQRLQITRYHRTNRFKGNDFQSIAPPSRTRFFLRRGIIVSPIDIGSNDSVSSKKENEIGQNKYRRLTTVGVELSRKDRLTGEEKIFKNVRHT